MSRLSGFGRAPVVARRRETPLLAALSPSVDEPTAPPKTAAALKADDSVQFDIVSELLRRGADVNQRGYQGITPLQKMAKMGYGEARSQRLVTLLLDAKADVDARDARGATALMAAARANRGAVVQLLMARGADTTVTDCAGQTALDIARSVGAGASLEASAANSSVAILSFTAAGLSALAVIGSARARMHS